MRVKKNTDMRESHAFRVRDARITRVTRVLRVILVCPCVFDSQNVQKNVTQIIYLGPLQSYQQFMLRQDARRKPSERVDQRTARKDASPCRGETVQKKTSVQAGESGAGRCRCKQRNPPAAVECNIVALFNTPKQEALLPILSKTQVNQLLQLCKKMNVDC